MKRQNKKISEAIKPYKQHRRYFNSQIINSNYLNASQMKKVEQKGQGHFLDGVSIASSVKIRQCPFQMEECKQCSSKEQKRDSQFVVSNKPKINQYENPEIYHLISKHIESNQTQKKNSEISIRKNTDVSLPSRFHSKSFSIDQFKKTPKITQFGRQTFYQNISTSRQKYSSKKQKQDNLHSNINFDINSNKISLCKRTVPFKQRNRFVSLEVYLLNKRIGVEASIMAGATNKQIKIKLIMNQADTKTFNKYWKTNVEQFLVKCLNISDDGISLKVGTFNVHSQSKNKSFRLQQTRKSYLGNYQSFIRKQIKPKIEPIRVGNVVFSSEYHSEKKKIIYEDRISQMNEQNQQSTQRNQSKEIKQANNSNSQMRLKNESESSNQIEQIKIEQSQLPNRSSLKEIIESQVINQEQSHSFSVKEELKIESS